VFHKGIKKAPTKKATEKLLSQKNQHREGEGVAQTALEGL